MVVNIDDYRPHEISELICVKCLRRWVAVYPEHILLKDIICECGCKGTVIKTGQNLEYSMEVE